MERMITGKEASGLVQGDVIVASNGEHRTVDVTCHMKEGFFVTYAGGGSDRFIDAMVVSGSVEEVKAGLRAHFDAGATHVCLQPVHAEGDWAHRDAMIEALAGT